MKKFIAVAALILIGVIVYNGRYMLSLGYNYVTWKPPIESVEPLKETTAVNPLDKYIETTPAVGPSSPSEAPESHESDDTVPSSEESQPIAKAGPTQPQQNTNPLTAEAAPVKPTMESIAGDYNARLKELEIQFRQSLDGLIESAITDYNSGKYSKLDLAAAYLEKGKELEKSSDERFYSLLSSLKSELSANGFDSTLANQIDQYYISMKNTEKSRIVNKGMDLVKNKN